MQPIYINCGSALTATDSTGQAWQPDTFYISGIGSSILTSGLEQDGAIFQTMRTTWQCFDLLPSPLKYDIPLPAADDEIFTVTLFLTEQFNFWAFVFGGPRHDARQCVGAGRVDLGPGRVGG